MSTVLPSSELGPLFIPSAVSSGFDTDGVPIGVTVPDRRPFYFDPVAVPEEITASTSMAVLGEMGFGKSTTVKALTSRSLNLRGRGLAVIDAQGENGEGEWAALALALGATRVRPGPDSGVRINPLDKQLGTSREELVTALAVTASGHHLDDLQGHALRCAVSRSRDLATLIRNLGNPIEEDARVASCTIGELASSGGRVAAALTRYTQGDLKGLFDGPTTDMPHPTDQFAVFDLSGLDPYSPAIPVLMAAITVWVEILWARCEDRLWNTLVVEEAWHLLDQDATAAALRRMLKYGRKTRFSVVPVTHTLADLTTEKARDMVRLAGTRVFHRLNPADAKAVGDEFGLPDWAVRKIPTLSAGEAVWQIGRDVRVVRTILSPDDQALMTTSSARNAARGGFDFDMPPNVVDVKQPTLFDPADNEEQAHTPVARRRKLRGAAVVAVTLAGCAWGLATLLGGAPTGEADKPTSTTPLAEQDPDTLTKQEKKEIFFRKDTLIQGVPMTVMVTPHLVEVDFGWTTEDFTQHRYEIEADGKSTNTTNETGAPAMLLLDNLDRPKCVTITVARLKDGEPHGGKMEQQQARVCTDD